MKSCSVQLFVCLLVVYSMYVPQSEAFKLKKLKKAALAAMMMHAGQAKPSKPEPPMMDMMMMNGICSEFHRSAVELFELEHVSQICLHATQHSRSYD